MYRKAGLAGLVPLAALLAPASSAWGAEAAETLQGDFDSAMQAIETDRLRTARQKLEALLAGNPSLHRARLELARVHYLSADFEKARVEAERVLADPNTPPGVRTTVLAFLAQVGEDEKRQGQRHSWTPSLFAGFMYDDNANIGPRNDVVDLGPVAEASLPREDVAWVLNPAVAHIWNPGRRFSAGEHDGSFIWQTEASAYYRGYFDEDDFNLGVLTLRTGPAWVVPRHWRAWIGLQADQIWFGGDDLALFARVNPGITWNIGKATELTLEGSLGHRDFRDDENSGREGDFSGADLTLTRYFNERRWALQAGIGFANFDADEDRFGYSSPHGHVGAIAEAWTGGTVFGRIGYANYDFDGVEPVYGFGRDDDELGFALGFEHEFRGGALQNWSLLGNWIFTDNDSNAGIYEYDRHTVNLGLSREF
ncbi:MAG: DUF560 domain-containing protein [Gammaproteobacteria bacterium]|nr:DUF560 domain-containing protein [Gammaproteobacteria bacterium]